MKSLPVPYVVLLCVNSFILSKNVSIGNRLDKNVETALSIIESRFNTAKKYK